MMGYNGAGVIDGTSNPADEREPISDCCGAELLGDSNDFICAECKEHCDVAGH